VKRAANPAYGASAKAKDVRTAPDRGTAIGLKQPTISHQNVLADEIFAARPAPID
jgi:hypothetical protein